VANRAYVSAWAKDYSEATQLENLARLLETAPFSASVPGFTGLVVRALNPSEPLVQEFDFRGRPLSVQEIISLMREATASDLAYEIRGQWDLWTFDAESIRWQNKPQTFQIDSYGPEYGEGANSGQEHFLIDLGFEHLFTGHGGLLSRNHASHDGGDAPEERRFLSIMAAPERLREYRERTRDNIQKLLSWMQLATVAVPLERYKMWSEGEGDLEATVDEILSVR
jgi:hypothetical protein